MRSSATTKTRNSKLLIKVILRKIANFRNMKIKYVGNSRKFHFIYESFQQEKRKSLFV